ncbi:MAG: rhodanese-related sulfurtransferase [Cocleimonas sp.]|jgi:rhodanese-related sulfurtransferase
MSSVKTLKDFVMEAKSQIEEVAVTEVETLMAEGYQVLDVREPGEFAAVAIAGAINVPRGVLEPAADLVTKGREELQDRDKKWLLFCASSGRSAMATVVLQQMGFQNVKNINGGLQGWEDAGMPVIKNT